jgi:hypothetical protein
VSTADETKKKLRVLTSEKTVLPEVLPDPRRPTGHAAPPRARTLAHMQRLLATAAAVSVAGSLSCGKESKTTQGGCNKPKEVNANAPDGGDVANDTPDANGMGYAVVDPMPMPAYCRGIDALIHASAKVVEQPNGATHVIVTFPLPKDRADFKYVSDAPVVGYGGSVVKSEHKADGLVVTMKADVASNPSSYMTVSVKGTCNQGPTTLSASISWAGPPKTANPTVHIQQY